MYSVLLHTLVPCVLRFLCEQTLWGVWHKWKFYGSSPECNKLSDESHPHADLARMAFIRGLVSGFWMLLYIKNMWPFNLAAEELTWSLPPLLGRFNLVTLRIPTALHKVKYAPPRQAH